MEINYETMTVANLMAMLDPPNTDEVNPPDTDEVNNAAVEVLTAILIQAAHFYDYYEFDDDHNVMRWRALELAACLVEADGIDETVARVITDLSGCIAMFAQVEGLSLETLASLKQIQNAGWFADETAE